MLIVIKDLTTNIRFGREAIREDKNGGLFRRDNSKRLSENIRALNILYKNRHKKI
jgi:hypothetical protein